MAPDTLNNRSSGVIRRIEVNPTAGIARHQAGRWWTYPCIMLITLGITRFRVPGVQHDSLTAAPPA